MHIANLSMSVGHRKQTNTLHINEKQKQQNFSDKASKQESGSEGQNSGKVHMIAKDRIVWT